MAQLSAWQDYVTDKLYIQLEIIYGYFPERQE